jgi:2-iminoacetate synthase
MELCKSRQIQNCCHPNALMTLMEYLMDYAAQETRSIGEDMIQRELSQIPSEKVKELVIEKLERIRNGERDFRF